TVTEVNGAPVLPAQSDRTVNELTQLVVTNTASDSDIPANVLNYTLLGPANAVIDGSGVITWTPSETQGPASYAFRTVVTDKRVPPLPSTTRFRSTVTEVNGAPVLPAQSDRTVNELTQLVVTNTASDSDIPANVLSYTLLGPAN